MIERTKEIGTMRAFGMHQKQVKNIFLWEATFLGLLGCVGGLVLAGVISLIVGNITFDADPSLQFFLNQGKSSLMCPLPALLLTRPLVLIACLPIRLHRLWPNVAHEGTRFSHMGVFR